jgi:hypothetical protein
MAFCCLLSREVASHLGVPAVVRVIVPLEIAVASYALLVHWRAPVIIDELRVLFSQESRMLRSRVEQMESVSDASPGRTGHATS